jgi:hypothetical protein
MKSLIRDFIQALIFAAVIGLPFVLYFLNMKA